MIELKYFKNIHGRIVNTRKNSFVMNDACVYADKENNRYAYLTLSNKAGDALLSILFSVRQYDATGQFLKEGKFYIPDCYHLAGEFEIDEPIPVERECDAVEVFVERAVFASKGFVNDKFVDVRRIPEPFGAKKPAQEVPQSIDIPHVQQYAAPTAPVAPVAPVASASGEVAMPVEGVQAEVSNVQPVVESSPEDTKDGTYTIKRRPFAVVPFVIGLILVALFVFVWFTSYSICQQDYDIIYGVGYGSLGL